MNREVTRSVCIGTLVTLLLAALVVIGSRRLHHFDAALVAYTFATLFAAFGVAYRYAMWLQRPPTAMAWKRGWRDFFELRSLPRNVPRLFGLVARRHAAHDFIAHRGVERWIAHLLLFWGCLLAALITFPLVFGWLHFETVEGSFDHYRVFVFGFETLRFPVDSTLAFLLFHGLVWSAFLVIPGVMLAMRRRMRDGGVIAVQRFGEDILPLLALFAVSLTGLLLWISYTWMHGYAYEFLAVIHAVTVILTLLWLPFGKFFHIFQRPAQIGVAFSKERAERLGPASCVRCSEAFAPRRQIEDLITVQRQLGYRYELHQEGVDHYQRVCPACRRRSFGLAQGRLWDQARPSLLSESPLEIERRGTHHG